MVIEAPELQAEVRGFLKDTTKPYVEILEEIYTEYHAQTSGEDIRGVPGDRASTNIALARRVNTEPTTVKDSNIERK